MGNIIFLWLGLSILVGYIGEKREGKFWPAFLSSLVLSPIIAGILTLLMKRKIPLEQQSLSQKENKPSYIKYVIIVGIILLITLPFHYIPEYLSVFPKDNFTFSNTFIFQSDIDRLIEKYNDASLVEKIRMMNDPLFKKLKEKELIYNVNENKSQQSDINTSESNGDPKAINNIDATVPESTNEPNYSAEDQKIIDKIKAKVKRDYPDNYSVQKMLFDQGVEAYFYMKSVPDLKIKRKVQQDYPLDFTVQKMLYNQEVDAKEQMK